MRPRRAPTPVRRASYTTVARPVVKLTLAALTPSAFESLRSMRRAQATHVMPVTGSSTRRLSPAADVFSMVADIGHIIERRTMNDRVGSRQLLK
jgi:hypothetical protein